MKSPGTKVLYLVAASLLLLGLACSTVTGLLGGDQYVSENSINTIPIDDSPQDNLPQNNPVEVENEEVGDEESEEYFYDFSDFGPIQFAEGVTEDMVPILPTNEFDYGVEEIYAIFRYEYMLDGTAWSRVWLYEGEEDVVRELVWDEGYEGISYAYYGYEPPEPLPAGTYTLNLYIEDTLASSADFIIYPEETAADLPPSEPEDIINVNLMPAWEILAYSHNDLLRDLAQFALDNHIEMILSDEVSSKGLYHCTQDSTEPGTLYIGEDFWNEASWEEVAAVIGHELTHAVQHIERGACYCSVENEYYAFLTEFYVLQESGRMDLLEEKWRGAYDENGSFDPNALWEALQEAYPECPDY